MNAACKLAVNVNDDAAWALVFARGAKATAEAAGSRRAGLRAGSAKWQSFGAGQRNWRWDCEGLALMGPTPLSLARANPGGIYRVVAERQFCFPC